MALAEAQDRYATAQAQQAATREGKVNEQQIEAHSGVDTQSPRARGSTRVASMHATRSARRCASWRRRCSGRHSGLSHSRTRRQACPPRDDVTADGDAVSVTANTVSAFVTTADEKVITSFCAYSVKVGGRHSLRRLHRRCCRRRCRRRID